jgi:hypothetical protein
MVEVDSSLRSEWVSGDETKMLRIVIVEGVA